METRSVPMAALGTLELVTALQYVSTLRSMSKGHANYSMKLANYDFVPPNVELELKAGFTNNLPQLKKIKIVPFLIIYHPKQNSMDSFIT
jgi:translation elongation factor EF-G